MPGFGATARCEAFTKGASWQDIQQDDRYHGGAHHRLAALAAHFRHRTYRGAGLRGGSIAGQVRIAPELASQLKPTDVLFVIVRRPSGPRPIAAKRFDQPKFPVSFEITGDDVMVKGTELKGMVDADVRVDRDGQAGQPQPGDMEGRHDKNPTLPGRQRREHYDRQGLLSGTTHQHMLRIEIEGQSETRQVKRKHPDSPSAY
ncbi:MAG: hypothetical protein U0361_04410 [Nitrospiraceae bacterium]